MEHLQQWLWEAQKAEEDKAAVMGLGLTTKADMETLKEAEIEMQTEMSATGPLTLSNWKRVVVLMQMNFQEVWI